MQIASPNEEKKASTSMVGSKDSKSSSIKLGSMGSKDNNAKRPHESTPLQPLGFLSGDKKQSNEVSFTP